MPILAGPMLTIGSGYMLWIGVTLAKSSIAVDAVDGVARGPSRRVFLQAVATCLLNPKAWLFTLAVYPQFLKPAYGSFWPQALVMGMMVVTLQFVIYGGLALIAARGRDAIVSNPALTTWIGRIAGLLLASVAAYTLSRGWRGL